MKETPAVIVCSYQWNALVERTYGRPYKFSAQAGARGRGDFRVNIAHNEEERDDIQDMHHYVPFDDWLNATPPPRREDGEYEHNEEYRWHNEFAPHPSILAYDLLKRGLIKDITHVLNVDW